MKMRTALIVLGFTISGVDYASTYSYADQIGFDASRTADEQVAPSELLGEWDVSLFFSSTAAPSKTTMTIQSVNHDGTLTGTFYNTAFETARYTQREGQVAFSILTSDGSGLYATSGRLVSKGRVEGQTLAAGRDFIMMWEATPKPE